MSSPNKRVDQICVVISEPVQQVRHYSIAEIRGMIVNFSAEQFYVSAQSWGLGPMCPPGIQGKVSPNLPQVLPAHSATGEMILLTLEINMDAFDAIENSMIGNFSLQYNDSAGGSYLTAPVLFQLVLQQ